MNSNTFHTRGLAAASQGCSATPKRTHDVARSRTRVSASDHTVGFHHEFDFSHKSSCVGSPVILTDINLCYRNLFFSFCWIKSTLCGGPSVYSVDGAVDPNKSRSLGDHRDSVLRFASVARFFCSCCSPRRENDCVNRAARLCPAQHVWISRRRRRGWLLPDCMRMLHVDVLRHCVRFLFSKSKTPSSWCA